ncbi:hypothetical protein SAMN04487906_0014 [Zhouia amylolytica]|uniref:Uncharacterized protein n=1 Tax=Zhouia amylolytica TaxID=376730 RepID=A0A1I6NY94_9FLAO|nr:hypothetical protein [Zhouia amylolytica]SFS32926.1 hypothetical protein SAMN04487906_0014 [Zhouia amylolytica]
MKTLVNGFGVVLITIIGLLFLISDRLSYKNSGEGKVSKDLGSFEKELKKEIEFDLYHRDYR